MDPMDRPIQREGALKSHSNSGPYVKATSRPNHMPREALKQESSNHESSISEGWRNTTSLCDDKNVAGSEAKIRKNGARMSQFWRKRPGGCFANNCLAREGCWPTEGRSFSVTKAF